MDQEPELYRHFRVLKDLVFEDSSKLTLQQRESLAFLAGALSADDDNLEKIWLDQEIN